MKALLIPVGEEPREVEVEGLADLQELVGGTIDAVGWVFDDSPTLYVNDEGKVNGMSPTARFTSPRRKTVARSGTGAPGPRAR